MVKQVLIIDDDEDDCDLFADAMKTLDEPVECRKAFSVESAVTLLKSPAYKPDYIFLDINMGIYGGKKCLLDIAQIETLKSTPVIMYTTSKRKEDKEWSMQLGAAHYITKPSSLTELCDEIDFVLHHDWSENHKHQ
ncbi:MAG TPA: response regulator [Chryseolinea sp.]|nr:response regulator [Chryseolinea sp.]